MFALKSVHMLTPSAEHDTDAGTEKKELSDLEGQLLEARRQLAVLKKNARARTKMRKNCPRELVLARTRMSNQLDANNPAELLRKAARVQTRRQQAVRLQALHTVSSTDRDAVVVDQTTNTDGLLLAVDKFLSTGDSHHPLLSNSRAVD